MEKINSLPLKKGFFEINNMDKFLVKPNKEKNKENMQMMNMKNEMKDIPSNHKDLKKIIRGYYG